MPERDDAEVPDTIHVPTKVRRAGGYVLPPSDPEPVSPTDSDPHLAAVLEKSSALTVAFVEALGVFDDLPKIEHPAHQRKALKLLANALAGPLCTAISHMDDERLTEFTRVYLEATLRNPNAFMLMVGFHGALMKAGAEEYKDEREVKPRYSERDLEIARLRDVERLRWKDVAKKINADPTWAAGGSLDEAAARKAYQRLKKQMG